MITINEYRRILAYFKGDILEKELTKKELKYAKKQVNQYLEITKQIEKLREFFDKQNKYEEENKK